MKRKLKKSAKKSARGVVKKAKKAVKKTVALTMPPVQKPIGRVTHFYSHLKVAIVKFNKDVKVGIKLHYKGATTDFTDIIKSMQFNHAPIKLAKKNKQIGIKVKKQVREGDKVFIGK